MNIVADYLRNKGRRVIEIQAERKPDLTRILLLVQLADFTSYYLALLNRVDPTPVAAIDEMKSKLSRIR
jgi:glucose/mannose-6-phosphate isomerase